MLVCYPQPGKARSREVLEAFASGWGGGDGEAFYGVVGIERLFRDAQGGDWFYGDNAFFDVCRGRFFRFARRAYQVASPQPPDLDRLRALGLAIRQWRVYGEHVLVIEQSAHYLDLVGAGPGWLERTVAEIRAATDRPMRVRRWDRDKSGAGATLKTDLARAWALVTHSSAAANEAILAGIPAFVTGPCAATPMASTRIAEIEEPRMPDGREEWAAGLANSQWTLEELRSGAAWRRLVDRR